MIRDDIKLILPRLAVATSAGMVLAFAGGWVLVVLDAPATSFYVVCGFLTAVVVAAAARPLLRPEPAARARIARRALADRWARPRRHDGA